MSDTVSDVASGDAVLSDKVLNDAVLSDKVLSDKVLSDWDIAGMPGMSVYRPDKEKMTDIGVAILGYGVVGKGVASAIRKNSDAIFNKSGIRLKLYRILDLLDFPDSPDAALVTHDIADILREGGINVVVETMGGVRAAYEFTRSALTRGKHVVTSNKELVAEYGPELLALAEENGVTYSFEASVGGGTPIIAPLMESLAANCILEIVGILNGTTNYMLTYMKEYGAEFDDTLRQAQEKGYAEKEPSSDIDGHDACRKIAILSSIAWHGYLDWKNISTDGISGVTLADLRHAEDMGRTLKLIARARHVGCGCVEAYVAPAMIAKNSPINSAAGVYNAILVRGDLAGDVMFYGQGAGMMPTGSAILSDILHMAEGKYVNPHWDKTAALAVADGGESVCGFYVRVDIGNGDANRNAGENRELVMDMFTRAFPDARLLPCDGTLAFTVPPMREDAFNRGLFDALSLTPNAKPGFVARILDI